MKNQINIRGILLVLSILLLGLVLNLTNTCIREGIRVDEANTFLFASGNLGYYYNMIESKLPPILEKTAVSEWKQYLEGGSWGGFRNIWKDSSVDVHPPLFYIVLNGWLLLLGKTLLTAKLINVVIYMLSAIAFFVLARNVFDRKYAFIALLLYCITPASFESSGEIRSYALLGLLNIVALLAVIKIVRESNNRRWWFAWIFASLAAIYTQYSYGVLFVFINLYLFIHALQKGDRWLLNRYLTAISIFTIMLIPLILLFWQQKSVAYDIGWSGAWFEDKNLPAVMIWIFFEIVIGSLKGTIFNLPSWLNMILGLTIYGSIFYFLTRFKNKRDFWLFSIALFVTTIFYAILYRLGALPSYAIGAKYQVAAVPIILISIISVIVGIKNKPLRIGAIILVTVLMFLGSVHYIWKNYKAREWTISAYTMAKLVPNADLVILDSTFSGLVGPVIFALPEGQRVIIGSQNDLLLSIDSGNVVNKENSLIYISAVKYNKLDLQDKIIERLSKIFGLKSKSHLEPVAQLGCNGAGPGYSIFYLRRINAVAG